MTAGQRRTSWLIPGAVLALVAIAALAFVLAVPPDQRSAQPIPSATPTASVAASPTTTATPGASPSPGVASPTPAATAGASGDRLGLIVSSEGVGPPLIVRSEGSSEAIDRMAGASSHAVSPDGRQIAAWVLDAQEVPKRLVTLTVGTGAAPNTVLDLPAGEHGGPLAWAADGRGLLVSVSSTASTTPGPGGGPSASFWRSVDLGTKAVVELARRSDGRIYAPVAWVRGAGEFASAIETGEGGFATAYYVWRPGTAVERSEMPATPQYGVTAGSVRASADGTRVLALGFGRVAVNEFVVVVWPADAPARSASLGARDGDTLDRAAFRPGSDEIGVQIGPMAVGGRGIRRFEIWTAAGQRRVVRDTGGFEFFRTDGTAAISEDDQVVDVASGRATAIPSVAARDRLLGAVVLR